jgi:type IV fimbrial biogenesis protein FimT
MKRDNGFTLIELLITMVVVAILLMVGVPGFKQLVKNNRISGQAGKLIMALQVARSEAVKRGAATVICASTDQLTCSGDSDWASGWIAFSDLDRDATLDGNGTCTTEADHLSKECIMRVTGALESVSVAGGDDYIAFQPGGHASNGPVIFTVKADNCEYQQQRRITVTRQGQTSSKKEDCS